MKYLKFNFFLLTFLLLNSALAFTVPPLTGPVVDEVGLLSASARQNIEKSIRDFKETHQAQIQVYVIKSLEGDDIASRSIQIFDQWKLGDTKRDDGVLFLIAPNEKRLRIEVGQGLEGVLPDIYAKRIVSDLVTPYFRSGDFDQGVEQGVVAIQKYISKEIQPLSKAQQAQTQQLSDKIPIELIFFGIFLLIFILNIFFRGGGGGRGFGRGGYGGPGWGGGGFGGGFGGGGWGGGGGSSSGGGASGGW